MKTNYARSWQNRELEIGTMKWEEYFNKEPLAEVIKKAVAESFEKR
jgi:hypothetical protein